MRIITLLICLAIYSSGISQSIVTEAPSVSSSAVTVPEGCFQLESTLTYSAYHTTSPQTRDFGLPSILFRYGVLKNFEARFTVTPNYHTEPFTAFFTPVSTFNITNIGVGLKYNFMKDQNAPAQFGIIAHYIFPYFYNISNDAEVINEKSTTLTGSFAYTFNEFHSVGANIIGGYGHFKDTDVMIEKTSMSEQLSIIYNYTGIERVTFFGEFFGLLEQESKDVGNPEIFNDKSYEYGADFGFLYLVRDNLQIDVALGYELNYKRLFNSVGIDILF